MKALWKGYITLGQLGIPVRLYAATQATGIRVVQLHEKDSSPVERPLFCKAEHKEIPYQEVIRGVEIEPGRYVTFTQQELERNHESASNSIEIRQFCSPLQVSPAFYEKPYYITPAIGGEYGYSLLREALVRTNTLAIGRFYFYGNEYIGAVGVVEDMLLLYRLRYSDELVPRSNIASPAIPRVNPSEVDMLRTIIERHSGPVYMRDYHDEHAQQLKVLCERKAKGLPMPVPERPLPGATTKKDVPSVLIHMAHQDDNLGSGPLPPPQVVSK